MLVSHQAECGVLGGTLLTTLRIAPMSTPVLGNGLAVMPMNWWYDCSGPPKYE